MPRKLRDLTDLKLGKLYVIGMVPRELWKHSNKAEWFCNCECDPSKIIIKVGNAITRKGQIAKSCGCDQYSGLDPKASFKHGHNLRNQTNKNGYVSPTYYSWVSMKTRCYNVNHKAYKDYGGRGIKVCRRWLNSFENFLLDMGERPIDKTLDRINNNGNYEPLNCKWSTSSEQNNNQRKRIFNRQ